MSEILQNTGVTLWSIRDDYDELQTSVFEALTGTGGKSNIRLIDEAIGNINSKLNGYCFEYSDDRLYICKKNEDENIKRYPVTLDDNNGHIASKVDGSTITIDENGIVRGLPVDDALSSISTNPVQNKVVKAKVDEIEKNVSKNTEDISKNSTNISSNTQKITSLETAVSSEKTRAESAENQLKTELENGKKVWDDKYTKSEVDNKLSTLETNIDWKEAVSTYDDIATTYPNPDDGWTVNVKDTDYTYRYNGTKWVAISANAIPKATSELDGLMTKEDKVKVDSFKQYKPDGTTITADEDGTIHGISKIDVDDALSDESTNPIQNKVVNEALEGKANNIIFDATNNKLSLASGETTLKEVVGIQKGYYVGGSAPENKSVLWIDSSDCGIAKYYVNSSQKWRPVRARGLTSSIDLIKEGYWTDIKPGSGITYGTISAIYDINANKITVGIDTISVASNAVVGPSSLIAIKVLEYNAGNKTINAVSANAPTTVSMNFKYPWAYIQFEGGDGAPYGLYKGTTTGSIKFEISNPFGRT